MTSSKDCDSFLLSLLSYLGWNQVKSCKYSELLVQIVDVLFLQLPWFSVHPLINRPCALTHLTLASILYSTHKHKRRGLFWRLHHKSSADVLLWGQTRLSDVCSGARMKIMLSAVREWVRQKEKGFCLKARPRGRVGGNGTAIRFPPPRLMIGYKTRLMFWTVCVSVRVCLRAFLSSVPRTYTFLVLSPSCS